MGGGGDVENVIRSILEDQPLKYKVCEYIKLCNSMVTTVYNYVKVKRRIVDKNKTSMKAFIHNK